MKHNLKYKNYFILNTDGERSFWHWSFLEALILWSNSLGIFMSAQFVNNMCVSEKEWFPFTYKDSSFFHAHLYFSKEILVLFI